MKNFATDEQDVSRNKMSAWSPFRATMTFDEDNEHLHDVFCYLHLIISKDWQVTKRFQLSVLRFFRALLAIRGPGADELKKAARCEIWQAATRKQIFSHHQTILGITGMLSHFMAMSLEQEIRKKYIYFLMNSEWSKQNVLNPKILVRISLSLIRYNY